MNTYVSINITNYGMDSKLNSGIIYISVENCKLEMCHRVSFEEAIKEMAKLAKKLGKAPTFSTNWFNPEISYRELRGYLD
jgi:hypothetical protein